MEWRIPEGGSKRRFQFLLDASPTVLSVGPAAPARTTVELGRRLTKNEVDANTALLRVAYREGGAQALRSYLEHRGARKITSLQRAIRIGLRPVAAGRWPAVKDLIARALAAPDRPRAMPTTPGPPEAIGRLASPIESIWRPQNLRSGIARRRSVSWIRYSNYSMT